MGIVGDKIVLRDAEREDMINRVRWFNDPEVNKTLLLEEELESGKTLEWFEKTKKDETRRDFVVESKDGKPIGFTGLVSINAVHGTAACYCVIGQKEYWGKGIGTEVHLRLVDWGFKSLGLHKIWADIRADNIAIIRVVEKLGFKVEGRLREEKNMGGQRVDVIRIGLLRDEFYGDHREFKEAP
jgi:RimJ/RimL family protein N-acetyltransferase